MTTARLETAYSTIEWSPDGAQVTKSRPGTADARRRFQNELRVNRLLNASPPPVPTPALVAHDVGCRSLTSVAVPGHPVGPKYPAALSAAQIDAIAELGRRLRPYNPRRRWMRRLNTARRLTTALSAGLLTRDQTTALIAVARRAHTRLRFAHGDLTARNVLQGAAGLTLIDWEWAGRYPDGYELAFFWFSLVDVEGGRERIEARLETDPTAFLLSALLVQLWHLQWYIPVEFRAKHLATRDDLVSRVLG
jgi:Ser/Thr protein kinase RdoA (MazF antagonist)